MSNPQVSKLIEELKSGFSTISDSRKEVLNDMALLFRKMITDNGSCSVVAVCTHNSRRSQIVQFWMAVASNLFLNDALTAYSGGTEITALNHRVIKAFTSFGFEIEKIENEENPIYFIDWNEEEESIGPLYSKIYNDPYNPTKDFYALMVCDHANEACPIIPGASKRIPLLYVDPKAFDDTSEENSAYRNKIIEIGKEILYCFANIMID